MKKFLLIWMPILFWAGLIFMFSSQPYEKQNLRPLLTEMVNLDWVSTQFSDFSVIYAGKVISVDTVGMVGFLEFCIRKGAHFLVFFILGWLVFRAFITILNSRQLVSFMISLCLVVLYAALDEYHQMFTENRTPLIHDVFLDISGGIIGIFLASLLYKRPDVAKNKVSLPSK